MEDLHKEVGILINSVIRNYEDAVLENAPSFASTQPEIIKLVDSYWSDKYRENANDNIGLRKVFYNIIEAPTMVASKMIDLDTKNITIIPEEGNSFYPAWLFMKDLKVWMKNTNFATLLNEITVTLPKYGTVIAKKSRDGVNLVPIQNFFSQPRVDKLEQSNGKVEKHDYEVNQLRKEDWGKEKIKEAIEKYAVDGHIGVYEVEGEIEGTDDNYFIVATAPRNFDLLEDEQDDNVADCIILHQTENKESLYRALHWDKVPGRWLGKGQVEKLFEAQISTNRIKNYKMRGLNWTSKHFYQTRDSTIGKNMLTDVDDGHIFVLEDSLTPVAVEERNLPAYRDAEAGWEDLAQKRTFSYPGISGDRPPAGTPLGTTVIQTQQAGGYFDFKRENMGIFIKGLLFDWVIPSFKDNNNVEHKLMLEEFNENELDTFRDLFIKNRYNKSILGYISKNKRIPSMEERAVLKMVVKERMKTEKDITIPAGYYKNLKYKIDIDITGESVNMQSKMTTLQTIMQVLGSNPTVLQDKNTRTVFFELMSMAGISPSKFKIDDTDELGGALAQMGGSVARPPQASTPQIEQTTQTI